MAVLSLENVTYRYKNAQRAAVSGISCEFEEGKVYALWELPVRENLRSCLCLRDWICRQREPSDFRGTAWQS